MTREPDEPIPGAGLRHAMALAVTLLLPFAYSVTAAAAAGIEGFSQLLAIVVTLATTVAAAFVSVAFPLPRIPAILGRVAILVVVAVAVRFTVPTPSVAFAELRAGEATIFSGATLVMLVLLGVAYLLGHGLAYLVSLVATGAPTTDLARERERRVLVVWWGVMVVLVFVAGVTPETGGTIAGVLVGASGLVSLLVIADLRVRTPPPGGRRAPVVAAPRRIRIGAVAFAAITTVALTAVLVPLVPVDALRSPPALPGWLDLGLPMIDPAGGEGFGTGVVEETDQDEPLDPVPEVDWNLPTIPWQLLAVLATLALVALLRPHRWKRGLLRLWHIFRRSRWLRGDDAEGELTDLDDADLDEEDARHRGRLRRALDRLRPRPRDPRAAVLHDYFHVERLLAKDERGRATYETPHEHAVRVHVSDAHAELADLAADARFARSAPDAAAVARSRELRREVEQALRGAQP